MRKHARELCKTDLGMAKLKMNRNIVDIYCVGRRYTYILSLIVKLFFTVHSEQASSFPALLVPWLSVYLLSRKTLCISTEIAFDMQELF